MLKTVKKHAEWRTLPTTNFAVYTVIRIDNLQSLQNVQSGAYFTDLDHEKTQNVTAYMDKNLEIAWHGTGYLDNDL